MHTVHFTWEDGHHSSESFKDNSEFYSYMDTMKEGGYFPKKMVTDSIELSQDGYEDSQGNWIEINY